VRARCYEMEMSGRSGFIRWVKNPTSISFDFHSPYHVLASAIIVLQMYTQMWLVLCTSRVRKFKIFELAHACFRLSSEIFITARAFWRHQLQEIYIYIYYYIFCRYASEDQIYFIWTFRSDEFYKVSNKPI